jgi:hypothetical protein
MLNLRYCHSKKSISLLLGAGFSVPMGYPNSEQLSEKLLNCSNDNLWFTPSGLLSGTERQPIKTEYDWYFDFCKDLMKYYNKGKFDYEKFYDYYNGDAKNDNELRNWFATKKYNGGEAKYEDYLSGVNIVFNQLVKFYLKDENGNDRYDNNITDFSTTFNRYTGFLNCIEELSKDYIINVHTLNHDVFFESLNKTRWINGELCDGFEELGSPFYGVLEYQNKKYTCRLSKYTGIYDKKVRLYKLHGSGDYHIFQSNKIMDNYIKINYDIDITNLKKEKRNEKRQLTYESDGTQYYPDFLTGTTSKIFRYKEPLYKHLFKLFEKNLKQAEILIIIGYGCRDAEVNNILLKNFRKKKKCYFVNPSDDVNDFIKEIGRNTEHIKEDSLEALKIPAPLPQ